MPSWRDDVLQVFAPEVARLTLCADPDGILVEETLLASIRSRGFDVLIFNEPVSFRFAYETRHRTYWDSGTQTYLVVIVPESMDRLQRLPYDILQIGRICSFALNDLFPNLNSAVLRELDRSDLDMLDQTVRQSSGVQLSQEATRDIVLQYVFGVSPAVIKQPADLLRTLLSLHYRNRQFPPPLQEHLIQIIQGQKQFVDWPLKQLISDRTALLAFLQERWPIYLDSLAYNFNEPVLHESGVSYNLRFAGPELLPFEQADVRVYMDTLFLDGHLHPIIHPAADTLAKQWVVVGLDTNTEITQTHRLERLFDTIEQSVPNEEARHRDWLAFAYRWAELTVLWQEMMGKHVQTLATRHRALCVQIDQTFLAWLKRRYAGLANQPPVPPVMVHHIPRVLARTYEQDPHQRQALLILDGLALDQWVIVREVLSQQIPDCRFNEEAAFAWLPTITPVSRQAIFAGKPPLFFASSIATTNKEAALWAHYWAEWQIAPAEVAYLKSIGTAESLYTVREQLANPRTHILGLVVDTVDRIMHGMQLGTAGMHNQVRQWAQGGLLAKLIQLLLDAKFKIFLTSDHGNVEVTGCGNPREGMIADLRGERVRVYTDQVLRAKVRSRFPMATEWEDTGLPPGYYALFAPVRSAFTTPGERIVAHGGPSLEEVIVPFVQIVRTST